MTHPDTNNRLEAENAENGDPSGTSADGFTGVLPSAHLSRSVARSLRRILFWTGECLGALSLFVLLFSSLFLGAILK